MEEQGCQERNDEIDLIDLGRILWKRRKFIVLLTVLVTLAAVVLSFTLPKQYEVSAIFEPGKNSSDVYVIAPEALKEGIVSEAYDYKIRKELNIAFVDYPKKIKALIPKGTSIVKVSIQTDKVDVSVKVLTKILDLVSDEVDSRLLYEKSKIENEILVAKIRNKSIDERIELNKKQVEATIEKVKNLEKNKLTALSKSSDSAMHVLLYSNEIQNQQIYLNDLQEKLKNIEEESRGADLRVNSLELQLKRLKGMNIMKPVTVSDKPVSPNKKLIVVLSFMSGLFFSIIFSFFSEYCEKNRFYITRE